MVHDSLLRTFGSRSAPLERLRIGPIACRNQRGVGGFNANSQPSGSEEQYFLHSIAIVSGLDERYRTEINPFAILRPWLSRILGRIAGRGKLRFNMEHNRHSGQV